MTTLRRLLGLWLDWLADRWDPALDLDAPWTDDLEEP
jgi:hypothetical protein